MPEPDLDLRLVRCFATVAEHRHFGRAAEVLHLTQPSLSRQIRKLEQQVGARLLDRTPRGTRLTEAGEAFLEPAGELLRAAGQAAARARAAARPHRFTVGYTMGIIVTPAVREMRHRHPDADIRVQYLEWNDTRTALLDRRVDAFVSRLPFPTDGLHVTVLYDEPRVVLVPLNHRLAGKDSVTLDDIADEPMPQLRDADPAWSAFWQIDPDRVRAAQGPLIDAIEDKFELVASGEAVAVSAGHGAAGIRPDITAVPLEGVEPSHVALATRADDRGRLAAAFRKYAKAHIVARPGGA